jgi:hypothetical protein
MDKPSWPSGHRQIAKFWGPFLCTDSLLASVQVCLQVTISILELSVKSPSVSPPISSAFGPYPLFRWYPQNKENSLNLGMKCWNSAFNAQGSRLIIVVVQVRAVKIYVVAVQALRKKESQDETTKLVERLVWVPVISFHKIFIPTSAFDALLCQNWPFFPLIDWLFR